MTGGPVDYARKLVDRAVTANPQSARARLASISIAGRNGDRKAALAAAGQMTNGKARAAAEDFEAMFLNSMFSQMMTKVDGEGPFGGSQATGVWRSFLTNEYAKAFAKAGGIGLAQHVYGALLAQQEVAAK